MKKIIIGTLIATTIFASTIFNTSASYYLGKAETVEANRIVNNIYRSMKDPCNGNLYEYNKKIKNIDNYSTFFKKNSSKYNFAKYIVRELNQKCIYNNTNDFFDGDDFFTDNYNKKLGNYYKISNGIEVRKNRRNIFLYDNEKLILKIFVHSKDSRKIKIKRLTGYKGKFLIEKKEYFGSSTKWIYNSYTKKTTKLSLIQKHYSGTEILKNETKIYVFNKNGRLLLETYLKKGEYPSFYIRNFSRRKGTFLITKTIKGDNPTSWIVGRGINKKINGKITNIRDSFYDNSTFFIADEYGMRTCYRLNNGKLKSIYNGFNLVNYSIYKYEIKISYKESWDKYNQTTYIRY